MGSTNFLTQCVKKTLTALPRAYSMRLALKLARILSEDFPDNFVAKTPFGDLRFIFSIEGAFFSENYLRNKIIEVETIEWIRSVIKHQEEMWDIGANIGFYTLCAAAGSAACVRAFEPRVSVFDDLTKNIALNKKQDKVFPYMIALAKQTSAGMLYHGAASFENGHSFVPEGETPPSFCRDPLHAIVAYSLDDFRDVFSLPPPDHIKLDVDGLEMDILQGAQKTLPAVKTLMVEVEGDLADDAEKTLIPFLKKFGFVEAKISGEQSGRNRFFRNKQQ